MFMRFVHEMRDEGITDDEVSTMIRDNPARVLDLD
jgi:predicted metal-dependent phosphotriesterase family hydrolase